MKTPFELIFWPTGRDGGGVGVTTLISSFFTSFLITGCFGVWGDVLVVVLGGVTLAGMTGDVGVVGSDGLIPGKIGSSMGAFGVEGRLWGGVRGLGESGPNLGRGGEIPGTVGNAKLGELIKGLCVGEVTGDTISASCFTSTSFFSTFSSFSAGGTGAEVACGASGSFLTSFLSSLFSSDFSAFRASVTILPSFGVEHIAIFL